jgi:hypothetical protein
MYALRSVSTDALTAGEEALSSGRWEEARAAYEAALAAGESPHRHVANVRTKLRQSSRAGAAALARARRPDLSGGPSRRNGPYR